MPNTILDERRASWTRPLVYDLLGIGFGPSNLALALTLQEDKERTGEAALRGVFLERRDDFAWHPDMLLDGARIQLSFLKDLVTLRDPTSRFTFLSYLRQKGRLEDFINMRQLFPTRVEFNDYYRWCANQVSDYVRYGTEVVDVLPIETEPGWIELLKVRARCRVTGAIEEYTTRNLVVATGSEPNLPCDAEIRAGGRVFHTANFLSRVEDRFPDAQAPYRFLVVGSGQSAAEIFQFLYTRYPNSDVTATMRRFAYKPADESHFVNELFQTGAVDFIFTLSAEDRRSLIQDHYDTNYSAVDRELIRDIYVTLYDHRVAGGDRMRVRPFMELRTVEETATAVVAELWNRVEKRLERVEVDGLILATGFRRRQRLPMLEKLAPYLLSDGAEGFQVERCYSIRAKSGFEPRIFLQGFCEGTHGLSDTLLSVLPMRSREILSSVTTSLDGARAVEKAG